MSARLSTSRIHFLTAITAAVFALTLLLGACGQKQNGHAPKAHNKQLFLAVDGLSWEAFQEAQARGLFKQFTQAGRLVAPYPSMSHPSWMEVMGTRRLFGMRGNVRTVEARWFDLEDMRVHDDPREVIGRQAGPFNYMRAFDSYFDPIIEPLMYFPGRRLFDHELEETERDILRGFNDTHFAVYISGSDALAHTHKDALFPYLHQLDSVLSRITDSLMARDSLTEIWMVSDHGNSGGFKEGDNEYYLKPVSLEAAAKRAGLNFRDSGTVTDSNSVAVVTIALASMINSYFPDLSRRRSFANEALKEEGVTLATWMEVTDSSRYIVVRDSVGEAHVYWNADSVEYRVLYGNPLAIPNDYHSTAQRRVAIHNKVARQITESGPWPDAFHRLIASAEKFVENAPDLIINLADGYCAKGEFGRVVKMVRTHGALSARASLGVIAGTKGNVPAFVRADEAMNVMQINESSLFGKVMATHMTHSSSAIQLANSNAQLSTGKRDISTDAAFLRRAHPIVQSMGYFAWNQMRGLFQLVTRLSEQKPAVDIKALKQTDVLQALTEGADPILELGDSLQSGDADRIVSQLAEFARSRRDLAPVADVLESWQKRTGTSSSEPIDELLAARQLAMAAWTIPPFLNVALESADTDSIADTRDITFATRWFERDKMDIHDRPERLYWSSHTASTLFKEVFNERKLLRKTGAGSMPLLYTHPAGDITVVLLPGIYTELFDNEIWQRGLRAVRDNLGVRTLSVPLDGRCNSDYNAIALLSALRLDTQRRIERGYAVPRYLLLGYSKGGVDATRALVADSAFAHNQVAALVTIATPHGGSPVPERADLPTIVAERSTTRAIPEPCKAPGAGASASISPQAQSDFWMREAANVAERTRLFSLTLTSSSGESHPFMQLTRRIGDFAEANDGVVAERSSRFPSTVPSTDLGTYRGDHIDGIRASNFPQEAFLEAAVITMAELGALDTKLSAAAHRARLSWLQQNTRRSGNAQVAKEFASDLRKPTPLPGGSSGWTPSSTFRTFDASMPGAKEVSLITRAMAPNGIAIRCDQKSIASFRAEYEFAYDGGNGGSEGSLDNGFSIVSNGQTESKRACRFATREAAIKMTTVSLRFRPVDFSALSFRVQVADNVNGVDPTSRRIGANDAAFKLWFVLRHRKEGMRDRTVLFGYTWDAPNTNGQPLGVNRLVEAVSSKRSVVIRTLPEAWLYTIGSNDVWTTFQRDLASDISQAYPTIPPHELEVIALTIQTDSDESRGRSLTFLDYITIGAK